MLFSGVFGCYWQCNAPYGATASQSALPFRTTTAPTWSSKQTSIYLCFSCV